MNKYELNMDKKHICFLSDSFGRDDALIVHRQGKSLVDAGYRVSFVVGDTKSPETKNGIEIIPVGYSFQGIKDRWINASKIFKNFVKNFKADAYMVTDPELIPVGLYLKKHGAKVTFNIREYYPDYFGRKIKSKIYYFFVSRFVRAYFKYASQRFDAIFNCMPEMEEQIREEMPCDHFENVANFPIVNKDFSLTFEDYCKRDNVVSYFGTIYGISCQEEFLQALERIPDMTYLLAGVCSKESLDKYMSYPGWKQVKFINGFTREELPSIINDSIMGNVMKDFSLTETPDGSYSIIKIFETMEAAVPVILAKVSLYESLVQKYHCGICVDPRNIDEIVAAINFLKENKKEAYEMGQNGRKAVIEEFSWDSQAIGYLNVIKDIL